MASFSNKTVHQPILVPLYTLHWMNDFLVSGLAGRGGINWLPQSPGLTPMDFFFWGFIKGIVYKRVESFPDLHRSITVAIGAVHVNVLSWFEVQFYFNVYRAVSGAHIELH
jgi:hypothetical protein